MQAKLRLMGKRILRKHRDPPDEQDATVAQQATALSEACALASCAQRRATGHWQIWCGVSGERRRPVIDCVR